MINNTNNTNKKLDLSAEKKNTNKISIGTVKINNTLVKKPSQRKISEDDTEKINNNTQYNNFNNYLGSNSKILQGKNQPSSTTNKNDKNKSEKKNNNTLGGNQVKQIISLPKKGTLNINKKK